MGSVWYGHAIAVNNRDVQKRLISLKRDSQKRTTPLRDLLHSRITHQKTFTSCSQGLVHTCKNVHLLFKCICTHRSVYIRILIHTHTQTHKRTDTQTQTQTQTQTHKQTHMYTYEYQCISISLPIHLCIWINLISRKDWANYCFCLFFLGRWRVHVLLLWPVWTPSPARSGTHLAAWPV